MGIIKQDISFPKGGGLNLDDDLTAFPRGDWRYLENMRSGVSAGENEGQFESILSDIVRTYTGDDHPTTNAEIMGGGTDLSTNKLYLLFRDTNDWIVEYDVENKVYNIVWNDAEDILNFEAGFKLHHINILNGILFWTDNFSSPRKLDIAKAKVTEGHKLYDEIVNVWLVPHTVQETPPGNHIYVAYKGYVYASTQTNPNSDPSTEDGWDLLCAVTDCYPELGEQEIDVIAHPPLSAPTISYETSSTKKTNNLKGKLFQFAYRYVYLDYRKSTYSPTSKVIIPVGGEMTGGQFNEDITVNNRLDITVNTGSPEVLRIEVVVRDSSDLSTWYKVDVIDVYNSEGEVVQEWGDDVDLKFYNNQLQVAVSTEDLLRPFDYVPLLAGCQEIIERSILTYADITEGIPPTILDIAAPTISKVDITTKESIIPVYGEEESGQAIIYFFKSEDVTDYIGETFYVSQKLGNAREKIGSKTVQISDSWTDVITDLKTDMFNKAMEIGTCGGGGDICFSLSVDEEAMIWSVYCSPLPLTKVPSLKSGSSHVVGIVYYERARRHGPVNVHDNLEFYLEFYNEAGGLKVNERYKVEFTLNHTPPPWATHYQLLYAVNQTMNWFLQIRIGHIVQDRRYDPGFPKIFIEPNTVLDDMQDNYTRLTIANYEWQIGDRIRFIGNVADSFNYVTEFLDYEIEGIDANNRLMINNFDYDSKNINDNTIIEIYRPAKESTTKIFYEIGQKYEIKEDGNGHLYHGGDTDQVLDAQGENVTGAIVEFTGHNSFKYGRSDTKQSYWVESPFYSDYEENGDMYDLGFVNVEDPDSRQTRYETKLRWGGAYFLDTELNFIAKFDYDDIETLPQKFGKIQKIVEVGFILKVLLSHKNYSFYIRRVSYLNPLGGERLTLTDQMFGTKRPELQDWGTQNPESVERHDNNLYFWDRSVGKFIRDAPNGMFAISDYKVKSFLKNLSLDNPSGAITCYTGYNNRFEELWATFRYNGTFKTLRFSEYKTRWDGFVNSNPDMYINLLQDFYKVYQEKIYDASSNESQGYLDFVNKTGNVYPIIEVVGNVDPYKVKIWNAIAYYASHVFFAPNNDDIEIPASNNYPDGMKTRILENLIEGKEGVWYAPIMMDLNTPGDDWGATIETGDLIDGREYKIITHSIVDFTTRGAANNNVGTTFVAVTNGAVTLTAVDSVKESRKALNGRPMRGDVIKIRLRGNEETSEKTLLSKMIIHATPSERSKL